MPSGYFDMPQEPRITENVLRRFSADAPIPPPATTPTATTPQGARP